MAAKRLLIVVNALSFFLSHRLAIAVAARNAGYEVHVAGPGSDGEVDVIQSHGCTAHHLPLARSSISPLRELASVRKTHALYRRLRPSIVHHVTIKPVLYGTMVARMARIPAVVNAIAGLGHVFVDEPGMKGGAGQFAIRQAYRRILRHPNMRIIFQNVDDQTLFHSSHIGRSDQYRLISGSGVELGLFRSTPESPEPLLVILPARMLYAKGVGDFVGAATMLRREGGGARFALVGDCDPGNPSSVPREVITNWVESGLVEWWGYRSDMQEVMRQSHIVCLPSYYREGLPKALIEAASSGRPIVTTDTPGCREVVKHGENGFLVPPRNVPALAAALRTLLGDANLRREMGRCGRFRAETLFSVESIVNEHLNVYRELLSQQAA